MEVPNTPDNAMKCICGKCPTHVEGDKTFFCAVDKSDLGFEQKGCICNDCALWELYELSDGYYCTDGKAT